MKPLPSNYPLHKQIATGAKPKKPVKKGVEKGFSSGLKKLKSIKY